MSSLIDLVKNIADKDVVKDVLPKAPDGIKKLRDLEEQVGSGGLGQAASAVQQMAKQASSALGSLQSVMSQLSAASSSSGSTAPTTPNGSFDTSHEEAAAATAVALTQLTTELNTITTFDAAMAALDTAAGPFSAFSDHEAFLSRFDVFWNVLDTLANRDLGILNELQTARLFTALDRLLRLWEEVPVDFFVHYSHLGEMTADFPAIMASLDFTGMDKAGFSEAASSLLVTIGTVIEDTTVRYGETCAEQLAYAAVILAEKMNRVWELDETATCIKDAVTKFYPELEGMLIDPKEITYEELTELLKKLMDAIRACTATKALGAPMGQSSSIPQIGSMIDKSMTDFLQKSILDEGKIKKALEKFTKKQAIVEKKREIINKMHEKTGGDGKTPEATPDVPVQDFGQDNVSDGGFNEIDAAASEPSTDGTQSLGGMNDMGNAW